MTTRSVSAALPIVANDLRVVSAATIRRLGTTNPRLKVTDSVGHRLVRLDQPVLTVGRRDTCDLQLAGSHVSAHHADITRTDAGFVVRDRTSRYGTFVNGELVTEGLLKHGDRIRLGHADGAELVFLVERDASSAQGLPMGSPGESLQLIAALLEGLGALGSGHVLDDVLDLVLDAAIKVTGAERGFIMLATPIGILEFTRARARGGVTLTGRTFETSRRIPEHVFATGETAIVNDLLDEDDTSEHAATIALGIRSVLCASLRLVQYSDTPTSVPDQKRIGVLYLDSRQRGKLLSSTSHDGLEALAIEAAVAIENTRLYRAALEKGRLDQELAIAAAIQRGLLPQARYMGAGFEIVAASLPCRAVGGDFFEHLELPTGDFGFTLGGVAGKGPPAALLTAALQALFIAHSEAGGGPAATLARVNRALIRRAIENRFATMAYGVLSPRGLLTYSNAGHRPPMLFKSKGPVRRLEQGGLVLGLFPHARYDEEAVQLDPGDVIVMFSEGVSGAIDAGGEEFGDDRLISCIQTHLALDPQTILDRLFDAVRQFRQGTVQRDDITALVFRYGGS